MWDELVEMALIAAILVAVAIGVLVMVGLARVS
jgi:hypothetical protein